jgi:hypothetical protein
LAVKTVQMTLERQLLARVDQRSALVFALGSITGTLSR